MTAGWPAAEAPEAGALRLVLTLALDRSEAAGLLARATESESLWPLAVVATLGEAAWTDEPLWRELSATLDRRLAPWLAAFEGRPLRDLVARLSDVDVDVPALTALLWSLVRRRQRSLGPSLARVVREVEDKIVGDAGQRARDLRVGRADRCAQSGSTAP